MKILIIEDEQQLLETMVEYLENEGYLCEAVESLNDAEMKVDLYNYDCVIVDITLPDGSGLDVIRELKDSKPGTGIIIVSAKNSLDDKIHGLDLGADDYMTKPFHLSELNARIKSLIRRKNFDGTNNIIFNEIEIEPENRQVTVCNKTVVLTKKELDLLMYFISNKERVVTREAIAEHLWGDNMDLADNFDFVYTHIKNLRKKLMNKGSEDYIQTIYGIGYKFSAK